MRIDSIPTMPKGQESSNIANLKALYDTAQKDFTGVSDNLFRVYSTPETSDNYSELSAEKDALIKKLETAGARRDEAYELYKNALTTQDK